jgi:hypothetical protein
VLVELGDAEERVSAAELAVLTSMVVAAGIALVGFGIGVWRGHSFARHVSILAIIAVAAIATPIFIYPHNAFKTVSTIGVVVALFLCGLIGPTLFRSRVAAVLFSATSAAMVWAIALWIALASSL